MNDPKTSIIVLNWNNWEDTLECLESLFSMTYPNYSIIVVDNGSNNNSVEKIKEWAKSKTKTIDLIQTGKNLGYAAGNNLGIRKALADTGVQNILVLNNDIVVKSDFLSQMVNVFSDNPKCGMVGPKMLNYPSGQYLQGPWRRRIKWHEIIMYYSPLKYLFAKVPFVSQHLLTGKDPQEIYVTSGCCLLFRREALEKINLFDENTFLGWEEWIISEKLVASGYKIFSVPSSIIYHKMGQSTKKMESAEKTIAFINSEKYVVNNYFRFPYHQRLLLSILELSIYSFGLLYNRSFRNKYFPLVKAIFNLRSL